MTSEVSETSEACGTLIAGAASSSRFRPDDLAGDDGVAQGKIGLATRSSRVISGWAERTIR
jgi:hypothetical protein